MAEILAISPEKPEPQLIERAVQLLRRGEVVGVPTDTLYGLAADPFNLAAVARLYQIKGRPERRALPILIASIDQAEELVGDLPDIFFHLAKRFWPGPLTLVVDASRRVPL
ncbi:MAG: L-threonylcarbamoyladenylate synthase, partial [Candidatus Acidiferrales bacterium]